VFLCYNAYVFVSGKQVKFLYEPVAVRHGIIFIPTEVPQLRDKPLEISEKVE